jgi:ribonuclease R
VGEVGGSPARPRRAADKAVGAAAADLAAVKGADRAAKAGTKATKGRAAHPVRAAKSAARKGGGKTAAKTPRRR